MSGMTHAVKVALGLVSPRKVKQSPPAPALTIAPVQIVPPGASGAAVLEETSGTGLKPVLLAEMDPQLEGEPADLPAKPESKSIDGSKTRSPSDCELPIFCRDCPDFAICD